ncbi:hypothetical protein SUGI_1168760 [Cryptomeria japonica]|nr:hypothetical protein SUGI_1168760 [Cryptomeria japonica]
MPHLGRMHLPHFPLQLGSKRGGDLPKGCVALDVGEGEEQKRCVIPVEYMNHPLFQKFLKEAEKEYGFQQKGRISIPCHFSDFLYVQEVIHRENDESHAPGCCFA